MPITQERMIDLIRAARAYKKAWITVCESIERNVAFHQTGDYTLQELTGHLLSLYRDTTPPLDLIAPLIREEGYFNKNERRNNGAAARAAHKRNLAGVRPQATLREDRFDRLPSLGPSEDQIRRMIPAATPIDYATPDPTAPTREDLLKRQTFAQTHAQEIAEEARLKAEREFKFSKDHLKRLEKNPELENVNAPPAPVDFGKL